MQSKDIVFLKTYRDTISGFHGKAIAIVKNYDSTEEVLLQPIAMGSTRPEGVWVNIETVELKEPIV